jgi:hypothetical protein
MFREIAGSGQPVFRTAVISEVVIRMVEQPLDTLLDRFIMYIHLSPSFWVDNQSCTNRTGVSNIITLIKGVLEALSATYYGVG